MSSSSSIIRLDGVLWVIQEGHYPVPICPKDRMQLDPHFPQYAAFSESFANHLICSECGEIYEIPRNYGAEKTFILRKIESKQLKSIKVINLDDEYVPLAEDTVREEGYFVTAKLTKTKIGLRLVIYAGKKGQKTKTQIFVEPENRRLAFDQNDIHPTEVFTKVEAIFADGSTHSLGAPEDTEPSESKPLDV